MYSLGNKSHFAKKYGKPLILIYCAFIEFFKENNRLF